MNQSDVEANCGGRGITIRLHQVLLIVSTVWLSWLAMMMTHESGHVLGAWVTGGTVEEVGHNPFSFSYTSLSHNPHPLLVAWAGPAVGVLLPVTAYMIVRMMRARWAYLLRFFAGFCLIANGAYIGTGAFTGVADGGDLLAHGATPIAMVTFGVLCTTAGLRLWHQLGPSFGFGEAHGRVCLRASYASAAVLLATVGAMSL